MGKKLMMLLLGVFSCLLVNAQVKTVTGRVTSADNGEPLIGVSVSVPGTTVGTNTNADGRFTLTRIPSGATTIRFSFIGMDAQELPIKRVMNVSLKSNDYVLKDAVVTALGIKRSARELGYSAQTLDMKELTDGHRSDVTSSLAGKVAGVTINATSGDPGQANSVIIRGISSINNNNQPLYVVDGIPLSQNSVQAQQHQVAAGGISNINPNDIEDLTVLKGAAATALYGSRAANGVIVITTKQGKAHGDRNFQIEYNGNVSWRSVTNLPKMQNSFGQGWNGTQTFIENGSWGPRFDGSYQLFGPIWNYQSMGHYYKAAKDNLVDFFDTGVSTSHSISVSGISNDEKMTYYLSYGYNSDNGIIPDDKDTYKRNTLSFKGSYSPLSWLKFTSGLNFAKANVSTVGAFQGASFIDGLFEFPRDHSLVDHKDLSSAFNTPEAWLTPYGITNPYWAIANHKHTNDNKQINGKVQLDAQVLNNLKLTYRLGFDYTDYEHKIGNPEIALDDALINDNRGYAPSNMNASGSVTSRFARAYEVNHDFMANFNKKFEDIKLDLNVLAGLNINERYFHSQTSSVEKLTIYSGFWNLANGASKTTMEENQWKRRLMGLYGQVSLGWDEQLFLELTARNDWSSTLPIDDNSFFYPGATLSWLFTHVIPQNDILNFGKLRLAYGQTGNDAGVYLTKNRYIQAYANGYYGSDIALFPVNGVNSFISATSMPSTNLKPEMTTEFEIGADLGFLKNRISLDFSYFHRVTKDQIFQLPVDPASGYQYMVTNFGKVRNSGIELLLNTVPVKTNDWRWELGFNFSKIDNKVLSMPSSLEGGRAIINSFSAGNDAVYMYAEKGKPIGEFYTYEVERTPDGKTIVDANGQPVLSKEVKDTGKSVNNDWTGGFTTSLTYKDFTLSAALDIRKGGYMFSRTKNLMQFTGNGTVTTYNDRRPFVIPNSVYAQMGSSGDVLYDPQDANKVLYTNTPNSTPIYMNNSSYQDYFNNYGYGDGGEAYLIDRSYVKLRNVTLAWNVPMKWAKALSLSGIQLSVFCNNVFTWTHKRNYFIDPETSSDGNDLEGLFGELYSNPSCRTFGFNVNIKF